MEREREKHAQVSRRENPSAPLAKGSASPPGGMRMLLRSSVLYLAAVRTNSRIGLSRDSVGSVRRHPTIQVEAGVGKSVGKGVGRG